MPVSEMSIGSLDRSYEEPLRGGPNGSAGAHARGSARRGRKLTTLVVEDSVSMRKLIGFTLKQAGHDVIEEANGQDALTRLEGLKVDLVITDLNMPVMDGISLIRAIRSRSKSRFTPVLILTTESQEQKKREGQAAGASGWIVKPFKPEHLLKIIENLVPL